MSQIKIFNDRHDRAKAGYKAAKAAFQLRMRSFPTTPAGAMLPPTPSAANNWLDRI